VRLSAVGKDQFRYLNFELLCRDAMLFTHDERNRGGTGHMPEQFTAFQLEKLKGSSRMPPWLEALINISAYAGFLICASRARPEEPQPR
jgi:hypothetical protein